MLEMWGVLANSGGKLLSEIEEDGCEELESNSEAKRFLTGSRSNQKNWRV